MSHEIDTTSDTEKTSVPWTFFDVALFVVLLVVSALVALIVAAVAASLQVVLHPNPIIERTAILFAFFLYLVVAAPLAEEFVFRLLFQGWLEAKLLRFRIPGARMIAIIVVSLCFAAMHGHSMSVGTAGTGALFCFLVAFAILNLLIFVFGIIYLIQKRSVKITNYLFGTEPFFRPRFFTNAGYCLLALLFCYGLGIIFFDEIVNTNTRIPVFCLSLVFGYLYSKTKNLSYCILLHATNNAVIATLLMISMMIS